MTCLASNQDPGVLTQVFLLPSWAVVELVNVLDLAGLGGFGGFYFFLVRIHRQEPQSTLGDLKVPMVLLWTSCPCLCALFCITEVPVTQHFSSPFWCCICGKQEQGQWCLGVPSTFLTQTCRMCRLHWVSGQQQKALCLLGPVLLFIIISSSVESFSRQRAPEQEPDLQLLLLKPRAIPGFLFQRIVCFRDDICPCTRDEIH